MQITTPTYDVGVIVARFQVPYLHEAHMELLNFVRARHARVLVFLGARPTRGTRGNPLDFETRAQMIVAAFPGLTVLPLKDHVNDEFWSGTLDRQVHDLIGPGKSIVLYGGRDSFIRHYHGRLPTLELESETAVSGTELRKKASLVPLPSADFRAGVIYAAHSRYPICYATVDVAVFDELEVNLLLGRKEGEIGWRFFGGFCEPRGGSDEADARREVQEEAGIAITDPKYLGSFDIEEWRYRGEADAIRTRFFKAKHFSGKIQAGDDIAEVRWFPYALLTDSDFVPSHLPLFHALQRKVAP